VQEQGVGRSEKPQLPYTGGLTDSYFPMPYFTDPAKGKGFLLKNSEFSRFELCTRDKNEWSVEVWGARNVSFAVFAGPKPSDVVKELTAETGRPKTVPPDWAMSGVWLAAQGGMEAVKQRVAAALGAGIPVSAVWVQDWVGRRHFGGGNYGVKYKWTYDEEYYPGLRNYIAELKKRNVRFLGYFNPFILPEFDQFKEAAANDYIVRDKTGAPFIFQIITFKGGLLDVSNPQAGEWFKSYARKAIDMGMSGWMADFGEWLPYDSQITAGDSRTFHNLYTTRWHRLNREALEDRLGADFVMFTRSGFTGEQGTAQIVWAGDQEADWTETDGIPTVVTAALSIGLSGIPYFTCDIAGFSGGPSGKELFMRWAELGAFMPVMRTHDGLQKLKNHRFDTDVETLAHFKKFAVIHSLLLPYFKTLAEEAKRTGLPIIRHTALVDPGWKESYAADKQWMIGSDILFAPVVEQGAENVQVSFPKGEWENLFTGERFAGREVRTVSAPIGRPAVFVRNGKLKGILKNIRKAGF
ncbi:MAG TPA: glycoside hydrolase family 31 protein, partial [bacterium]|nr:glycoside hydrolase family 31 protein [bacterium]